MYTLSLYPCILLSFVLFSAYTENDFCPAPTSAASCSHYSRQYPQTKNLHWSVKKRILVTGGAGFVGSHLVDRLMTEGHDVIAMDNFATGSRRNIEHWLGHPNFELLHHDVSIPIVMQVDEIYHLASPASPPHYMKNPIRTIKANTIGTLNMLGMARRTDSKFLFASTSEVYGDPEIHPQTESYWGHVNPIGPRACYDESKRLGETLTSSYVNRLGLSVRIARIFNTYGPRMHMNDGRVVSNFIIEALTKKPLTIYGTGTQTRSFQYVSDLVDGLVRLMASNYSYPVNIGNPIEYTVLELSEIIRNLTGSNSPVEFQNRPVDDPERRRPVISLAKEQLDWEPKTNFIDGALQTIEYFREALNLNPHN